MTGGVVTPITAVAKMSPRPSGSRGGAVAAAVASRWPNVGVADLATVVSWAAEQADTNDADVLIRHLLEEVDPAVDPRVTLALRISAPLAAAAPTPADSAPDSRFDAAGARPCFISHELIQRDLSDCAVQVWLVLGMHPRVRREAFPLPAWWIAERAGWVDATSQATERRVQRAVKELAAAGLLEVIRQPIGGGRTRPAYRRLGEPGERGKEMVTSADVRTLRPALLRSYLRWLQVMGHRHQTRLSLEDLAARWQLSVKQARRHRDGLVVAGLLQVEGRTVLDRRRASAPRSTVGHIRDDGRGTFLSGGGDTNVGLREKNYIPTDGHTSAGTSVPTVENPSGAATPPGWSGVAELPVPAARAAQAPPAGNRDIGHRDEPLLAAGQIVASISWLRTAPREVRFQARSLLTGQIRRLSNGVSAADLAGALRDRVEADDVGNQQCRTIRAVVAGLRADACAVDPDTTPRRGTRQQRYAPPTAPTAEAEPLEVWRTEPLPPEPSWREELTDSAAYDWLARFFAHASGETYDTQKLQLLLTRVQRHLPERYHDLAGAAADTVRALAGRPIRRQRSQLASTVVGDPLAVLPWLVSVLETPLEPAPDWTSADAAAGDWLLRALVHQVAAAQDAGDGEPVEPTAAAEIAADGLRRQLQHLGHFAALECALGQLVAVYRDGTLPWSAEPTVVSSEVGADDETLRAGHRVEWSSGKEVL